MPDTRRLLALLLTAFAFSATACGDDNNETPDGGGGQSDAPIVDDKPQGDTDADVPTPAPGEE
jgi:hypothetical protein